MNRNDRFPSTRGMTDREVEARQRESRRVTRETQEGPIVLRHPNHLLPRKWRWQLGWRR